MRKYLSLIAVAAAMTSAPAIAQRVEPAPARPNALEVEARLAAAFAKYDEGKKGYLTETEFHMMMDTEQGGSDEAKSSAVYAAADADDNAELSLDEFISFVKAQLQARSQPEGQRGGGARRVAQFDEMWSKYDTEGVGWLDQEQFVAMMAEVAEKARAMQAQMGRDGAGAGQWSADKAEQRARDTFAAADADANGELTQEEFKAHFAARMGERRQRREDGRGTTDMQGPVTGD